MKRRIFKLFLLFFLLLSFSAYSQYRERRKYREWVNPYDVELTANVMARKQANREANLALIGKYLDRINKGFSVFFQNQELDRFKSHSYYMQALYEMYVADLKKFNNQRLDFSFNSDSDYVIENLKFYENEITKVFEKIKKGN